MGGAMGNSARLRASMSEEELAEDSRRRQAAGSIPGLIKGDRQKGLDAYLRRLENWAAALERKQLLLEGHQVKKPIRRQRQSIYVIGAEGGPVEIGMTADVHRRLGKLQSSCPTRLRVFFAKEIAGDRAYSIEQRAHAALNKYRLDSEWFGVTAHLAVQTIKGLT